MEADADRLAWLRLALAEDLGPARAHALVRALGSAARAADPPPSRLRALLGPRRGADLGRALHRCRPAAILRRAGELGQSVLTPADVDYPHAACAGLADPPAALFLRGRLPEPDATTVAVVGTRDASPYGLRTARALAIELAGAGVWVVSGLALGIDGAAHEGALAAGGATLAVLGCGLDVSYPVAHEDLRERIPVDGGLLGEHAPGVEPRRWHFPRRNRLVAALSQAVVVVEAPERSGALITARLALDLGREVLAVPGPVGRTSHAGCHRLLRQGAAGLCERAADVFEQLGLAWPHGPAGGGAGARAAPSDGTQALLWRLLDDVDALDANTLCLRSGLDPTDVAAALSGLEIDGFIRRIPGVGFARR